MEDWNKGAAHNPEYTRDTQQMLSGVVAYVSLPALVLTPYSFLSVHSLLSRHIGMLAPVVDDEPIARMVFSETDYE